MRASVRATPAAAFASILTVAISSSFLGACGPSPRPETVGAKPARASQPRSPLSLAFDEHCTMCHGSGDPGKPPLDGDAVGRDVLVRAAILVAAEQMPPPPQTISPAQRKDLVVMLCEKAGPLEACPALRAGDGVGPPVVLGEEYLTIARELAPSDAGAPAESWIEGYRVSNLQTLDATYLAHQAVLAGQRCPAPVGQDAGAFRACAGKLIDPPRGRVPEMASP